MNTDVRDNTRYLKGLDGTAQIESGLEITGTAGFVRFPGLTNAQQSPLGVASGVVTYNSERQDMEVVLPIGTVTDWHGWRDMAKKRIAGQAIGDFIYADTGTSFTRRAVGTGDQFVGVTGGVPTWKTVPGGTLKVGYGEYTGTVQMNRPIAHGMGVVPRQILAVHASPGTLFYMIGTFARWFGNNAITIDNEDVTTSDSTSFYLGTNANASPNQDGFGYYWVAIG